MKKTFLLQIILLLAFYSYASDVKPILHIISDKIADVGDELTYTGLNKIISLHP